MNCTIEDLDIMDLELTMAIKWDLVTFVHACFLELHPGQEFSWAGHIEVVAATLAKTLLGNGPKRLIINLPPRSLKSITVSIAAVAWLLGHDPTKEILCASYGQELAAKLARDTKRIMAQPFYRSVFPATVVSPSRTAAHDFKTTMQGGRMATSVGGVITGRGGDVIILDDPLKPDEALSESQRKALQEWYDNSLLSRLNNKNEGIIIIVMQRLHQDDLVGYVQGRGEDWQVLSFPAMAEEPEEHVVDTAFGQFVFKREVGEVLDPTRESYEKLQEIKQQTGTYNFSAQYQQNPTPQGGAMVRREWLKYYESTASLPDFSTKIQCWDTANKSGELNDFSVCTTWGAYRGDYYLLDVFRKRLNYPELKRAVVEQNVRHSPNHVIIEDKASGTQLIQDLKSGGMHHIKPYEPMPQMDKIMRLHAQTHHFENGHVFLPNSPPWLDEYVRELTSFPGTKFDDQVDSTAQALDYLSRINKNWDLWARLAGY